MKKVIKLTLVMLSLSNSAYADINSELGKVWQSLGNEVVTNGSAYYQGQRGGHYTMGSVYMARQRKNRPLLSVNFPEINLDKSCYNQGVLNFGGISFISGDELKNKLQGIVQQAGMMMVYLGVSSISPVIGETLQEVYSKLQEIGGFLSDECQAAKQIVGMTGDALGQHSAVAKDIFANIKTEQGSKGNLSEAYKTFPIGKNEALESAAKKDERKTIQNVNLAWKALEKVVGRNNEIKELMMTISGTVIIRANSKDTDSPPDIQYISSQITSPNLLEALMKGNQSMPLISCNDKDKCLKTELKTKNVSRAESFEAKVSEYFELFRDALKNDEELEMKAQTFLAKSGLPIFKMYDVIFQYSKGNPEYEQGILIEMVAWNILYNYLADLLKEADEAASNLQVSAMQELKSFKDGVYQAKQALLEFETKDIARYQLQMMQIKRSESIEASLAGEVQSMFSIMQARS
jgi:conjugative transfer pilus assembly protein TraH